MLRKTFIRNVGIANSLLAVSPLSCSIGKADEYEFPLMDLHVHLTDNFTIDHLLDISKKTNVQFGIVVNPGYGVNDDSSLKKFIDSLLP